MNRPLGQIRSVALLTAVILLYPLFLLWDSIVLFLSRTNQTINIMSNYGDGIFFISLAVEAFIFLVFILFGASRKKMLVPAAFVLALNQIVKITANYSISAAVSPLVDMRNIYMVALQFPHIFYINIFLNSVIIASSCLLAARWMHDHPAKQPFKPYAFFCMVFIIFSLVTTVWFIDIRKNLYFSYSVFALFGAMLLGVLLLLFYLYTRQIVNAGKMDTVINLESYNNLQIFQQISRREQEVVEAILAGNMRYKEIAGKLGISVSTVKTHLKHIYRVTKTSSIAGLSSYFRGHGQDQP